MYFRKCLTPEVLGEINERILSERAQKQDDSNHCDDGGGSSPGHRHHRQIIQTVLSLQAMGLDFLLWRSWLFVQYLIAVSI